jgi:hypothetical protein
MSRICASVTKACELGSASCSAWQSARAARRWLVPPSPDRWSKASIKLSGSLPPGTDARFTGLGRGTQGARKPFTLLVVCELGGAPFRVLDDAGETPPAPLP